ncbi:hypothetical protein RJ53_08305 [Methanocalculus chunghsingensis]|uniref:Nucleotide-binding protein n=1 Tax=Methanocalculus chunghsingensis TaxID=156457 RepID=A0A8J8B7B5_9EURY|nr:hypothetical protein [Methanocalculus chunghsingensis]MBR1369492.1 hypothetical protein [Methanocalculus chunghsingensis]
MVYRPERKALFLLLGSLLIILLIHAGITVTGPETFSEPFDPTLSDGSRVSIEGSVEEIQKTRSGGHWNAVVSGTRIFIPRGTGDPGLRIGDQVTIYGILTTYEGKREITVQNMRDIIRY